MRKTIELKLLPEEAANETLLYQLAAKVCGVPLHELTGVAIRRKSLDARGKTVWVNLKAEVFIDEHFESYSLPIFPFQQVSQAAHRAIIVGAGPAGLFAALSCLCQGIKPIVLERGKDIKNRRRDLAAINRKGEVNPESNYCFGEGGAGTYSDGKLYTRSTKRGNVERILQMLVHFGASPSILYEAHPHIGTNKLPQIIANIRSCIEAYGGEVHFNTRVSGFLIDRGTLHGVVAHDGTQWKGDACVLATGHSARDVFRLLQTSHIFIEAKPFALGVRIEHPQALIDTAQYHCQVRNAFLPPASYSLVHQVQGRGVFSFCMCPGGIIAPAATGQQEVVVNGWSPSKRNNPFANSGMVVEIKTGDLKAIRCDFEQITGLAASGLESALGMMYFQHYVERKAYHHGGGALVAPAQRITDFVAKRNSVNLPACSYQPGITPADLGEVLPPFVAQSLRDALQVFGKKMKGYLSAEAVMVATESRTSSPVRIPRSPDTLQHPQIKGLFPCGEGAGYAGGIISAAIDGENCAQAMARSLKGE